MNPIPADWALATTHLASDYVSQQFCSIVGAMLKVLPPPELDMVLLVACCNLARRLADAYLNPVTINFDMVHYSEALHMQETGMNPRRKESLLERYPLGGQLILEWPTVVLDRFGVIVLWYLPGAIDEAIKGNGARTRAIFKPVNTALLQVASIYLWDGFCKVIRLQSFILKYQRLLNRMGQLYVRRSSGWRFLLQVTSVTWPPYHFPFILALTIYRLVLLYRLSIDQILGTVPVPRIARLYAHACTFLP
ncbi:uncharacterized protein F5147DRAFT_778275 [Suillus discolor]|uniref:Uncharacterized protein n=1 Tax=Suillus discolor TaxID=1912936 RepID=A0A9P7JPW6_9AGAM|nr:uncharacterized protein F5147DRAFT_778275 [Suillus discolor]KAG2096764.1 hypothetical protein F5147DRAFT_778275 [Suillus discolor]